MIVFFAAEDGEAVYSQKKKKNQDQELTVAQIMNRILIAKFRLKLKKVGKTTRLFKCDLSQIPYVYTVEVTNRFKGLDLIDRVPEELWTDICEIVQEAGIKTMSKKMKCKKAK